MDYRVETFPHNQIERTIHSAYNLARQIQSDRVAKEPKIEYKPLESSTGTSEVRINGRKVGFIGPGNTTHIANEISSAKNEYAAAIRRRSEWKNSFIEELVNGVYYERFLSLPYHSDLLELSYYNPNNPGMIYLIPQAAAVLLSSL